jgi:hypothetical protein
MRHQTPLTLSSTPRNRHDSPLLRLPAELRNKIYSYVLTGLRRILLVHVYAYAHHRLCPSDVANLKWKLAEDIQGKVEVEFVQRLTTYS